MDIRLFLRHAMSAHRKQAQANRHVAASLDQLIGCPSMRMTPPRKIRTTIKMRNTAATHASAAHRRSYSFVIGARLAAQFFPISLCTAFLASVILRTS